MGRLVDAVRRRVVDAEGNYLLDAGVAATGRLIDDAGDRLIDADGSYLVDSETIAGGGVVSASASLVGFVVLVDDAENALLDADGNRLGIEGAADGNVSVSDGSVQEQPSGGGVSGPQQFLFSLPAEAPGATLTCSTSVLSGLVRAVSFLPGGARSGARPSGAAVELSASVLPGSVTAEQNPTDEEMLLLFAEAA